jgi:aminoglycoside phosphotransferase (APT) family kinase protein
LRNTICKLRLDSSPAWIVLRIYQHDPALCQKEMDVMRLVAGAVPVPEVLHAAPHGFEDLPPFALLRYVEGITLRELKRSGDADAIAEAAHSAGETLAAIGRAAFSEPGWLAPGPTVPGPLLEGADPLPRFVDLCMASPIFEARVPAGLRSRTHEFVWSQARQYTNLSNEARLVHGDFNGRNLIVRRAAGRWSVAAVLDWEFAISGSPFDDLGNLLRYERIGRRVFEPHFSRGYQDAGGTLPHDWRHLARRADLIAICESLTHEQLPPDAAAELVELLRATVEV